MKTLPLNRGVKACIMLPLLTCLLACSCEQSTSPEGNARISAFSADPASIDVWLRIKTEGSVGGQQLTLRRGDSTIHRFAALADTTVIDEGLQPASSYSYGVRLESSGEVFSGQSLTVTTLDTTSHNFTWQIDTFGTSASLLRDVAIINENDIWAVGEIHTEDTDRFDSLGNWVPPYNAVHWNGIEWQLKRILVDYRGQPNWAPLHGVFALPSGEVVFSSGLPYLPENNQWKLYHLWDMGILDQMDGSVYRIWGTSLNDLYFAGRNGTIVYHNGDRWWKMESGTDLEIYDIFGQENQDDGEFEIYAVAAQQLFSYEQHILKVTRQGITIIPDSGIPSSIHGLWFRKNGPYWVVGSGMFYSGSSRPKSTWHWQALGITSYYLYAIRGSDVNNVFACGAFGEMLHFNGLGWQSYKQQFDLTALYNIAISANGNVIAVGQKQNKAIVITGQPGQ